MFAINNCIGCKEPIAPETEDVFNPETNEHWHLHCHVSEDNGGVTSTPDPSKVTANGTVYDDATLIEIQRGEIKNLNKIIRDYQQFGEIQPDPVERCPECLSAGPHHKYCSRGNKPA